MTTFPTTLIDGKTAATAEKIVSGVAFRLCRSLWVGTAGTATIIDSQGNTLTNFPMLAGETPISCTTVTFGTAADVWALY